MSLTTIKYTGISTAEVGGRRTSRLGSSEGITIEVTISKDDSLQA